MDDCPHCGESFGPSPNGKQVYCTPKCKQAAYRAEQKPDLSDRRCLYCAGSMQGRAPQARYCRYRCRDRARRDRERAKD